MDKPLLTYLHDHLAGARFAVNLLRDLGDQQVDPEVQHCAARLLADIDEDRSTLEAYMKGVGDDNSLVKDIAAWVSQKASRFKLALHEPLGLFEAIEALSLGVLGKLALWNALKVLRQAQSHPEHPDASTLDLEPLIARAVSQHQELESLRLKLAIRALRANPDN